MHIPVVASAPVSSESIVPTATSTSLTLRPSASAETAVGEHTSWYTENVAGIIFGDCPNFSIC